MSPISKINEQKIRKLFSNCADVQLKVHILYNKSKSERVLFVYSSGMIDTIHMNQFVLPNLQSNTLQLIPIICDKKDTEQQITLKVFSGELILLFEETGELCSLNISKIPQRQPEESSYEVSIKGARDGFTESLETNVALLRKRIRSTTLCNEIFTIGKRSQTSVSLLYLSDVMNESIIAEARNRLNSIDIDILNGVSPLEELLSDSPYTIIPSLTYNTRPDMIVESLQRGRFCILIDGAPAALIAPINLQFLLKSAEDLYMPYYFVTLERILRYLGLLISVLLPGFYVAMVSFHQDQIPFPALATISINCKGIPFPPGMEVIIMTILFELLYEAGLRLPKSTGQTVTVVGALIVGETMIRSGLTSPNVVVIVAITLISQFLIVNISFGSAVILMRAVSILMACILGYPGLMLALFLILIYVSTLKSFGVSYMSSFNNPSDSDYLKGLIQLPKPFMRKTPKFLYTKLERQQGDKLN
ncbi:spore germination protein [Gottfriedia acidiceleris]|uniref:spore germination protein n=1 Tax=Bacillaceae TaxID=186817 RepID=UPI000BEB6100|nr:MULTISPECIES: spore germination protein [unclassified Bacillus (in: firmicutes)]PEC49175.1 spore germination protein [Bacillus sp. AFS096315]PFM75405.1 spore germination protein [Bacillus sp. AFS077874]